MNSHVLRVNGVRYHVTTVGERRNGPPLVLLHGFTGSTESWRPLWDQPVWQRWVAGRPVVAVDLLGHGRTEAPEEPDRYAVHHAVADLAALFDRLGLATADLLGYSMGGRLGLHAALSLPGRIRALALESASPGLDDPAERATRQQQDEALAELLVHHGVAAFVERWERLPLFASQQRLPEPVQAELRDQRLRNRAPGLAGSLRGMGAGNTPSVWPRLNQLAMPCLLLAGELDGKYVAIAQAAAARIPQARVAVVPGAGHTVHLEQPDAFARLVAGFFDTVEMEGLARHGGQLATNP